jgi:type 1 fimbria pilin
MRHAMIHKGLALLLTFGLAATAQAVDNLRFKGNLVEQACTIRPGDEAITLELWDLTSKHLYINTRSVGKRFTLHLDDCNTTIKTVRCLVCSPWMVAVVPLVSGWVWRR